MDFNEDEEEYDVSNTVVTEYLTQFVEFKGDGIDLNTKSELRNSNTILVDKSVANAHSCKNENKLSTNCKLSFGLLYDMPKLLELISNRNILKEDKNAILLIYMKYFPSHSSHFISYLKNLFNPLFLIFIIPLYFWFTNLIIYFSITFFVFIFFNQLDIFNSILIILNSFIDDYVQTITSLIYYLKEIQLVSFSINRANALENKRAECIDIEKDDINFPFRRLVFNELKSNFYKLKSLNLKWLVLNNELKLIQDESNQICMIEQQELSPVLSLNISDEDLTNLTDHFSFNCIKSVNKLNCLLMSEHFKLTISLFLGFVFEIKKKNPITIILFLFKLYFNLLKTLYMIQQMKKRISILFDTCRLLNDDFKDDQLTNENRETKRNFVKNDLAINLRSCLLTVYEISNSTNIGENSKLFSILKTNMKYVDAYYKQYLKEMDNETFPDSNESSIQKIQVESSIKERDVIIDTQLESTSPLLVDEIFEADTFNIADIKPNSEQFKHGETNIKEAIFNKNLIYELKFALKTKKDEWKDREKHAKRIIDENSKVILGEISKLNDKGDDYIFCDDDINDHLLDNEKLKYRAKLLRNRRNKNFKAESSLNITKKQKYNYEEFDENSSYNSFKNINQNDTSSILNDFMAKRNMVLEFSGNKFLQPNDEEIIE